MRSNSESVKRLNTIVKKHMEYYEKNMSPQPVETPEKRRKGRYKRVKYMGREFEIYHNPVGESAGNVCGRGLPEYRLRLPARIKAMASL